MFRARLRIPRVSLALRQRPVQRRCLHQVPALPEFENEGIPGLLSADGFNMAYYEYMQFATEKLNSLTAGTELEHDNLNTIIGKTAREPSQAPVFNYASMLFNNHFFFKNLKPRENPLEDGSDTPNLVPQALQDALVASFSSMETLRLEMTVTANAMFGPGFVWLVRNKKTQDFKILTTYLAGSPLPQAHWRRQPVDTNTMEGPSSSEQTGNAAEFLGRMQRGAGALTGSDFHNVAPGGIDVIPLLCINTWEHVWLRDYGVGAGGYLGKRAYIDNWWHCINWEKVLADALLRPMMKQK